MYTFLIATSISIYFIASDYHSLSERYNPVRKARRMRIYDITQTIRNGMPVWPGDPEVRLNWLSQISQGGPVNLTEIHMCTHSGTHIDMPSHFLDQGQNLDDLVLNNLIGRARVISVPPEVKVISGAFLATVALGGVERVLFKTANSELVKADPSSFHENYVALDASGAEFLAETGCKLVGIDYMSVAVFDDPEGGHLPLLRAGIVVLEGITLEGVEPGDYQLIALPLKLGGREGAPARAILLDAWN
jgi:arylformamidase